MISLIGALVLAQTPIIKADRFDMGERLKLVDIAWLGTKDQARRTAAVSAISSAVMGFFGGKASDACKNLDLARAYLEGRVPQPSEAITLRAKTPFCEPTGTVTIEASWAYLPSGSPKLDVSLGDQKATLAAGEGREFSVPIASVVAEITRTNELGALVPVRVDGRVRSVFVSVVRNAATRIKELTQSKDEVARTIGERLAIYREQPERMEAEMPLIDHLFLAERLEDGKSKLEDLAEIPLVRYEGSAFRVAFPPKVIGKRDVPVNLVIALHGAGGSENMFFESYGRGLAAKEALKRGWVFVSPSSTMTASQNAVNWLQTVRGLKLGKVFVMGHSMGGGIALGSGRMTPKPSAVALFAPAAGSAAKRDTQVPIFLAVGKQEIGMLRNSVLALSRDMSSRADFKFKEFDPCEHLMIVADALPDAYAFFDRHAR